MSNTSINLSEIKLLTEGKRILLVDDESEMLELFSAIFKRLFQEVVCVENAQEALNIYRQQGGFHLVMTDLHMPYMSGLELAGLIKEINPQQPVVLVTGSTTGVDIAAEELSIMAGVINKPIDRNDVYRLLKKVFAD